MSMLVRKGTMVRKKRNQSIRRAASPKLTDCESGGKSRVTDKSMLSAPARAYEGSYSTLDDEKSLCRSASDFSGGYHYDNDSGGGSYGSIFHQLEEVNEECDDSLEFLCRAMDIIWSSWLLTIFLVSLSGLPIAMIVIGGSYRTDCPREPKIPIYLLVGGGFGLLKVLLLLWRQKKSRDDDRLDCIDDDNDDVVMSRSTRFTGYILTLFIVTWFVLGNVWIFKIWKPNFTQPLHEPMNWCDETVYMFSVYQLFACYGLLGMAVFLLITLLIVYVVLKFKVKPAQNK